MELCELPPSAPPAVFRFARGLAVFGGAGGLLWRDIFLCVIFGWRGFGIFGCCDAFAGGRACDAEVDKAFFAIDGGDRERNAHAELDHDAVGRDPCHAVGFEAPASGGQIFAFDHATDAHVGDFDHEAHRAYIGDESVEDVWVVHFRDAREVIEEFDLFCFRLRFGRGAFGVGNVA